MDPRKQAIIDALRTFVCQRPGFDPNNYGDVASYRADSRTATRQRDDALQFLRDIELHDSISADDILKEAKSGRVSITMDPHVFDAAIDYCTGQYFPTEFRGAVARLCASVLWTWKREQCIPAAYKSEQTYEKLSAGDWLRASFRREYGRTLAGRYFD